jgi:hypothetical protein
MLFFLNAKFVVLFEETLRKSWKNVSKMALYHKIGQICGFLFSILNKNQIQNMFKNFIFKFKP